MQEIIFIESEMNNEGAKTEGEDEVYKDYEGGGEE